MISFPMKRSYRVCGSGEDMNVKLVGDICNADLGSSGCIHLETLRASVSASTFHKKVCGVHKSALCLSHRQPGITVHAGK